MLRWFDGFETERSVGHHARKYVQLSSTPTFTNEGWDGWGRCISSNIAIWETPQLVALVENTWIIGMAISQTNFIAPAETHGCVTVLRSGSGPSGDQLAFRTMPDPTYPLERFIIEVRRGTTTLATYGPFFLRRTTVVWYYLEFKAVIDPVNGSWELKMHRYTPQGLLTQTFTEAGPINTANTGVAGADRVAWDYDVSASSGTQFQDDLYICDSTGLEFNDFLGPRIVDEIRGVGNGNQLDWVLAGSAANIEDALNELSQSTGEDDKRITSDVVGDISLMSITPLVNVLEGDVDAVFLSLTAKMDSSGTRTIAPRLRKTTGTPAEVDGSSIVLNSTTYQTFLELFIDDPNTGVDWVLSDLNGVQIGVHLVS